MTRRIPRGLTSPGEQLARTEALLSQLERQGAEEGNRRQETLQAVREAISQVTAYLTLGSRHGDEVDALCPFHDDRSFGNFQMNLHTGFFFCWACGAKGGLVRLAKHVGAAVSTLELLKHIDFDEFSRYLLETLGVRDNEDGSNFILPESLLTKFPYLPTRYINRGHSKELLLEMEVSFDPNFNRVVFPVRRITGELVAVQSRAVEEDDPIRWKFYKAEIHKLLAKAEIADYELEDYEPPRSAVLFNEHNILLHLLGGRLRLPLVLLEGPGGALRTIAAGYPVLGTFGTQLAPVQLQRVLHCYRHVQTRNKQHPVVIIAGDGDQAGWKAAVRNAVELGPSFDTRLVRMPDGMDAEDHTPPVLRKMLAEAPRFVDLLTESSDEGAVVRNVLEVVMDDKAREMRYSRPARKRWSEEPQESGQERRLEAGLNRLRRTQTEE